MVYVFDMDGRPLMPTQRHGKVRHLLKERKAKVVKKNPFTIKLLYDSTRSTQPVTLGVDAGSKPIGLSASSEDKELLAWDVQNRTDITELISTRREARHTRRNRKTRYRAPRQDTELHASITESVPNTKDGLLPLLNTRLALIFIALKKSKRFFL